MSKHSGKQEIQKNDGFRAVCSIAALFLAVVLAVSTLHQLRRGQVLSGIISLLGTVLFALVAGILLTGLIRAAAAKRKK